MAGAQCVLMSTSARLASTALLTFSILFSIKRSDSVGFHNVNNISTVAINFNTVFTDITE